MEGSAVVGSVCIVGYGRVGKLYGAFFAKSNTEILIVDPLPLKGVISSPSIEDLQVQRPLNTIALFVVSSPTEEHLSAVEKILLHSPAARIIIEKPVVEEDQIELFQQLLAKYPAARILEASQYLRTSVVSGFIDIVRLHTGKQIGITKISCEFTKNRVWDNLMGRFRGAHLGPLAYEGPHLLALVENLLLQLNYESLSSTNHFSCYLKAVSEDASDEGSVGYRLKHAGRPEIELYTSTTGRVGNEISHPNFPTEIPVKSSERLRLLTLDTHCNGKFILKLEPQYRSNGESVRNQYEIYHLLGGRCQQIGAFSASVLEEGIAFNTELLTSENTDIGQMLHASIARLRILSALAALPTSEQIDPLKKQKSQ